MIYAQDQASISFPTGTDDGTPATLTTQFFMAETEVTNAVVAAVLQWAYDEDWFSSSGHNELSPSTVKYGNQELLDLDDSDCRVDYDGSGTFSAQSGYEHNPVTDISWYGAIMICNWLTEMRDGNTDNVVYTSIDTSWTDDETIENISRNGYRLPSRDEWEYAARYRGTDTTNTVSGYSNPYFTQGDSASGATADYNDASACQAVAVYSGQNPAPTDEEAVKSLGSGSENTLGIYDISGNVWEWCFTEDGSLRIDRGGSWSLNADDLQVGYWLSTNPYNAYSNLGFRVCRTAD
jgi:formylglycine-generating enzyme required for sulfatase activity